jgi:ring-1,2-phenylacetyl-CoA epoxidase subunit PaaA
MGLEIPDPQLERDPETGHWRTGPIDWEEFAAVLRGEGACNDDRLDARRRAHEEGAWVREAAAAYEAKRSRERLSA